MGVDCIFLPGLVTVALISIISTVSLLSGLRSTFRKNKPLKFLIKILLIALVGSLVVELVFVFLGCAIKLSLKEHLLQIVILIPSLTLIMYSGFYLGAFLRYLAKYFKKG